MRRKDREITDPAGILAIARRCEECSVALTDGEYPYVIPMNFGIKEDGGRFCLYFHCAGGGRKLELLKKNPNAAFAMSCDHSLEGDSCRCTMRYSSVCGRGKLRVLGPDEKPEAMNAIMENYRAEKFAGSPSMLEHVTMLVLEVEEISGKSNIAARESPRG